MKVYCYSCGHPTQYVGEMPNFCQSCGQGLKQDEIKNYSNTAASKISEHSDEDGRGEEERLSASLPDIDELEVEIHVDKPRSFTLGEIFKEMNNSENDTQPDGKKKK